MPGPQNDSSKFEVKTAPWNAAYEIDDGLLKIKTTDSSKWPGCMILIAEVPILSNVVKTI